MFISELKKKDIARRGKLKIFLQKKRPREAGGLRIKSFYAKTLLIGRAVRLVFGSAPAREKAALDYAARGNGLD